MRQTRVADRIAFLETSVQFADCRSVSSCLISGDAKLPTILANRQIMQIARITVRRKLSPALHSAGSSPLLLCNVRPDRISRFDRNSCVVAGNARCRHLHMYVDCVRVQN